MNQRESTKYIETYLNRNDYSELFNTDPHTLLAENRRVSRHGNTIKYGRIPFTVIGKKKMVNYKIEDLQDLCNNKIKPMCEEREKIRAAKALKALESSRLPYED